MRVDSWPYSIDISGDVDRGSPAVLTIDSSKHLTDEIHTRMRYAVESFVALAAAGGLGGDHVPPDRSTAISSDIQPTALGTRVSWDLTMLSIDPRGLSVLFNMLSLLVDDLASVNVQTLGNGPYASLSQGDLPPVWPQIPFHQDDDRTGPVVELNLEFAQFLSEAETKTVLDGLQIWLDCGSVRGYGDLTLDPDQSFLVPTEDPPFRISGSTVSALLEDSGVLEGCYDILNNILVKIHRTVPIVEIELV